MAWAAVAGSAISVAGGLLGSSSSKKAAKQQAQAAQDAAAQQRAYAQMAINNNNQQFDWTKGLYSPYLQSGNNALSALNYALGTTYGGGSGSQSGFTPVSAKKITENDLIESSGGAWKPNQELYSTSPEYKDAYDKLYAAQQRIYGGIPFYSKSDSDLATARSLLNKSYDFNVDSYNAKQQAEADAKNAQLKAEWEANKTTAQSDPSYGQLLKNYGWDQFNQEYGSNINPANLLKAFSQEDFQESPGYQFRLGEGNKAINHALASRGMYDSGAALKELDRYNSDQASQEWSNAYNQDSQNKARVLGQYNTAFGQDTNNKSRVFNFLQSVAGMGQNATNNLSNIGANYAGMNSNLLAGTGVAQSNATQTAGNAQAAGTVGGMNALTNGLSGAFNNYQTSNFLSNIGNNPSWMPSANSGQLSTVPQAPSGMNWGSMMTPYQG